MSENVSNVRAPSAAWRQRCMSSSQSSAKPSAMCAPWILNDIAGNVSVKKK